MSSFITGCIGESIVRCPVCGGKALLDDPFEFYSVTAGLSEELSQRAQQWGGWLVVERYPSVIKWVEPGKGVGYEHRRGVIKCLACHNVKAENVSWPDDAYYRWDIRGNTLWACNREHAEVLLAFLGSKERDESHFPGYEKSLRKLPTEFISAKVREDIVKAISRTLEAEKD